MKSNELINQRMKFWLIVWMFIGLPFLIYVYFTHPYKKCLRTESSTSLETYYDFSESGMGIWQAPSTKTICVEYEELPK